MLFLIILVVFASIAVPAHAFSIPASYSQSHGTKTPYSTAVSVGSYTVPGTNRTYALGWLPEEVPPEARLAAQAITVPPHFDWRNKDGYNWMTSVKDQGGCGSCVAFGVVGAVESQYRFAYNNPTWDLDLSEQHLFSCGGGSCAVGWTLSGALNYLKNTGTPDESCFPYQSLDGADRACSTTCPNWQSRTYKIDGWNWNAPGSGTIEAALMNSPVVAAFTVYEDFFYYTNGVYRHTWGNPVGGHAAAIVGYDIPGQYWIAKNSWGTSWGDHGYFNIGFGEGGIDSWTASITVRAPIQTVTATATVTLTESSTSYLYRSTTTTITSYSTSTSTSTIPTVTTVALLPLTVTSIVQSIQYLTSLVTTTLTSYTGTETSTSTIVVPTTLTVAPSTSTSTVQTTQILTSTGTTTKTSYKTTTATSYTGTQTSTSTIVVPTTVTIGPSTTTRTVQTTQVVTSTGTPAVTSYTTTTATSYTATTTSTSTLVVYTTVTKSEAGGGSSPLAYLGFLSLLVITVDKVTTGRSWRIPKAGSWMGRKCSRTKLPISPVPWCD